MDLPLAPPDDLIRPWRTAALVAGAIALVELLILVAIGGTALARGVSHRVQRAAAAHEASASAAPRRLSRHTKPQPARLPRSKTEVLVLNGNGRQGAAASEATSVQRHGYQLGGVANASRSDYARSIVMYRPRYQGEGRRLGRDLGIALVTPLDGMRASQLHGAHVVVIIGR